MFTQTYEVLVGYALGGTAAVVLFILLFRKANRVASSGNKAQMAGFSVMPAVLVILSIAATTAAFNYAIPRLQSAVTSQPVMGAVQAGGIAMQAIDGVFSAPPPSGGFNPAIGFNVQPMNVGSGSFQPIVPNSGWAGGALNSVAPGSMFVMPTVEPTQVSQPPASAPVYATPYIKPTPIHQEIVAVAGGHDRYTVQPGDSMYKIAAKLLGSGQRYGELCAANVAVVGSNCSALRSGMVLKIPSDIQAYQPPQLQTNMQTVSNRTYVAPTKAPVVNRVAPTATPQRVPVAVESAQKTYTIAAGDSMFAIAGKNGGMGAMYDICRVNISVLGPNCDQLKVGATLVIP